MEALLLVAAVLALILVIIYQMMGKPPNFPPGPPRLPILGSMPFLPKLPMWRLCNYLSEKYGPISGVYFGPFRSIIISDLNLLREAFKMDSVSGRNTIEPLNEIRFGGKDGSCRGVLLSNGSEWTEQRRFALRHLRDFGFGKKSMEELIMTEVQKLCKEVEKTCNLPETSLISPVNIAIVNALWTIVTGENYDLDDPRILKIVQTIDTAVRSTNRLNIWAYYFPGLARHFWEGFKQFRKAFNDIWALVGPVIKHHEETLDPNSMRDFIDVYLQEIAKSEPESSFFGEFGRKSLYASLTDLFITGSETPASAILRAVLLVLKYPAVQSRIHKELDSVASTDAFITLEEEAKLPFTKAVMLESMRFVTHLPMSMPHVTTSDTHINGYFIPKGTQVIANLHLIHFNPKHWEDPGVFKPERFLSDDGQHIIEKECFVPFSVGKRECLGKTLAEKEFFLFFANLMHKFSFSNVEGQELPSFEPEDDYSKGIIRSVPLYNVKVNMRK